MAPKRKTTSTVIVSSSSTDENIENGGKRARGNKKIDDEEDTVACEGSIESKITLAQQWKEGKDPTGYLMSEKLDGMRAYWTNGKLWTRTGKLIYAPDWFIRGLPDDEDLDGELFLGRQQFDACMSIARRMDASDNWRQLKYVVFDCPTAAGGIKTRLKRAEELLKGCGNEYAIIHPHTICKSQDELMTKLTEIQDLGGEGLMLRHPTAAHRGGRTPDLLKVKTFLDDEALVIDHEPGKGKYVGKVGSLICINKAGTRFKVGSGLTDEIRSYRTAPQIGQVITFKYFELTKDNVPRFPTYMRIRPDVDASVFPN